MTPKVCIIGAGVSGIACLKELKEAGISVDVFEMMPVIGGVFGSYVWKGGRLTSSSIFTWYSQYPAKDRQTFFTWDELVKYLEGYVDHFGLASNIHLNSKVLAAEYKNNLWRVRVKQGNWSNGHFSHPQISVAETEALKEYTHLVVCSGLHNVPAIPMLEGLDRFSGVALHSSEYRDAEAFRGKRVLVVGSGESGSDIAAQISELASSCAISLRSPPGTLFPRFIQGNTADIRDDRLTYNLPRAWWRFILKGHRRYYLMQTADRDLFQWAADSNYHNLRCPFNTNACKSFGIPEAVVRNNATLKPQIRSIDGARVIFSDDSSMEFDAIVFCTGFRQELGFFDSEISRRLLPVNKLWKNILPAGFGGTLFVSGFSRPNQINLISIGEMQARLIALLISGLKPLPSPEERVDDIRRDSAWMNQYFGDRYAKNPALVDFLYYMDGMAKVIGCEVPLAKAFFKNPKLWAKLVFASLNGAHYRLRGPGSNWDTAAKIILETPYFNNRRNAMQRWTVLSFLTMVSLVAGAFSKRLRLVRAQS